MFKRSAIADTRPLCGTSGGSGGSAAPPPSAESLLASPAELPAVVGELAALVKPPGDVTPLAAFTTFCCALTREARRAGERVNDGKLLGFFPACWLESVELPAPPFSGMSTNGAVVVVGWWCVVVGGRLWWWWTVVVDGGGGEWWWVMVVSGGWWMVVVVVVVVDGGWCCCC